MCSAFRLEARVKIKIFALLYRSNTMTMTLVFSLLAVSTMPQGAASFSLGLSRRQTFAQTANVAGSIATAVAFPNLGANAEVTEETPRVVTRMGGLLVSLYLAVGGDQLLFPCAIGWSLILKINFKNSIPHTGVIPRRSPRLQDYGSFWMEQI